MRKLRQGEVKAFSQDRKLRVARLGRERTYMRFEESVGTAPSAMMSCCWPLSAGNGNTLVPE